VGGGGQTAAAAAAVSMRVMYGTARVCVDMSLAGHTQALALLNVESSSTAQHHMMSQHDSTM
jgi:hypothetical protein